jgi:hypothetical protein
MNDSQISDLSDVPSTGSNIGDIFKIADDALHNRSGFNSEALTRIRALCRAHMMRKYAWGDLPHEVKNMRPTFSQNREFRSTPNIPSEAP